MSSRSPDGKRVRRSRSPGTAEETQRGTNSRVQEQSPRRETRSQRQRQFEKDSAKLQQEAPIARNHDSAEGQSVSRTPAPLLSVRRNPDCGPDQTLPVPRNHDDGTDQTLPVSRDPDCRIDLPTSGAEVTSDYNTSTAELPTTVFTKNSDPGVKEQNFENLQMESSIQPVASFGDSNNDQRTESDVPVTKDADGNKSCCVASNMENAHQVDGPSPVSQPAASENVSRTFETEETNTSSQKELTSDEDFAPLKELKKSGPSTAMDYFPFDDWKYNPVDDIPQLVRHAYPKKPSFSLGEPYPAPQLKLRPRYWKEDAAEIVSGTRKRKHGQSWEKRKKPKMAPTSATCVLNEKYPGLEYVFGDPTGPPHALRFTVSVNFPALGGDFSATGTSKKNAKNNLAELILDRLGIEFPRKIEDQDVPMPEVERRPISMQSAPTTGPPPFPLFPPSYEMPPAAPIDTYKNIDFAADDILEISAARPAGSAPNPAQPPPIVQQPQPFWIPQSLLRRLKNIPNLEENAVLALHTLVSPKASTFNFISEEGPPHEKKFTTELILNDKYQGQLKFIGIGGSKKKSKANAAIQALENMIGPEMFVALAQRSYNLGQLQETFEQPNKRMDPMNIEMAAVSDPPQLDMSAEPYADQYNNAFATHVRNMVMAKYDELIIDHPDHTSQKVLAGVVLTWAVPFIENSTVLVVTTGTKCIEGDCMSTGGLALNDCHAEVLATRCLRDYLYSQIDDFRSGDILPENCIFDPLPDEDGVQRFKLKEGLLFHLYISTSPCGDARIFSPKGLECEEDELEAPGEEQIVDNHPNRANRGVLRVKIESGEGTIPVANFDPGPQTWDGVVQGNALRTMSCSDKVCRWNVVGFQGALLSNLMEPIYYSSIILGSLHHPIHFERAVYGRIEKLSDQLQLPYSLNRPKLLMISDNSKRQVKKSPNHAVLWSANWGAPEIVAASKGRCLNPDMASRVAKRLQFIRFLRIYKNPDGRRERYAELYYADAKNLAKQYQTTLNQMKDYFKSTGLGSWTSKPMEQDSFYILK